MKLKQVLIKNIKKILYFDIICFVIATFS